MAYGLDKALAHLARVFQAELAETRMYHVDATELHRDLGADRWQSLLSSPMDARRYMLEERAADLDCPECEHADYVDGYGARRRPRLDG